MACGHPRAARIADSRGYPRKDRPSSGDGEVNPEQETRARNAIIFGICLTACLWAVLGAVVWAIIA